MTCSEIIERFGSFEAAWAFLGTTKGTHRGRSECQLCGSIKKPNPSWKRGCCQACYDLIRDSFGPRLERKLEALRAAGQQS